MTLAPCSGTRRTTPELGDDASGLVLASCGIAGISTQSGIWIVRIDPATAAVASGATPAQAPRTGTIGFQGFVFACSPVGTWRVVYPRRAWSRHARRAASRRR